MKNQEAIDYLNNLQQGMFCTVNIPICNDKEKIPITVMYMGKDKDGRYIFPIYNNDGITSIATVPVVVEEELADGDFLIGNAKNYILNFVKHTEVYPELHGKTRVIEYTAHLMVAGKAAPNKFYYGKLSTTKPTE